jgi:Zn-dependent protease with chaperone function
MTGNSQMPRADALSRSASVETAAHVTVLICVLLPLLGVVFPALLILVGFTMLTASAPDSAVGQWISRSEVAPFSIACVLAAIVGVFGALFAPQRSATATKLREPVGRDGQKLVELTQKIWQQTRGKGRMPTVRWFPAMDIAAYAAMPGGRSEVHVSAGLWRSAVSGEPAAQAILAHELAHLRYRDPLLLALLAHICTAIRAILLVMSLLGLVVIVWVLILETQIMLLKNNNISFIIGGWLRILGAASVVVILMPLAWLAIRRQIAFITSLIEIRADVAGAVYTEGLEHFTQLFATHKGVARSGSRNFLSSLVSIELTHIPERERIGILASPQLIITPKIQFFAFSLLLVFLLPINFASPLLWGGAANHIAMQAITITFNAALVIMIIVGRSAAKIQISTRRLVGLAAASVMITALPRINLEPLSYLAMSWIAGFGGQPADLSSLPHDVAVTASDLAGKARVALLNRGAVVAGAVSTLSLLALYVAAPAAAWIPAWLRVAAALLLVSAGSVIAGHDEFRAQDLGLAEATQSWLNAQEVDPSATLCLPLILPAFAEIVLALVSRLLSWVMPR